MWDFGKYKTIVISIALFLLLDASVLMLNFYISFEISDDAVGVNIAGRQRMLSQRMVKSLFDIDYSEVNSESSVDALTELALTVNLFDKTLNAFESGGITTDPSGNQIRIAPVKDDASRDAIEKARTIWLPYKENLAPFINSQSNEILSTEIESSIQYAKNNNLLLLKYMNDLTVALEKVASSKATTLRIIQTIGISLAIINFFIIMFHFLKQLKESDNKIEKARKETQDILNTVNEGLFLLDKTLHIGSQRSQKLSDMFQRNDLDNLSFNDLLRDIVSNKMLETSERFVNLFYRKDINSTLIQDLNPLTQVELNFTTEEGDYITRFFSFSFNRVFNDEDEIVSILTTVIDVTEKVYLEKELAHSRKASEKQLELLTEILNTQPEVLDNFLNSCFKNYKLINGYLKRSAKTNDAFIKNLNDTFTTTHGLKGDASAIGLDGFTNIVHKMEDTISELKKLKEINGNDLLPLIVEFESLIRYTESIQQLTNKLSHFSIDKTENESNKQSKSVSKLNNRSSYLNNFCQTLAHNNHKKVQLVTSGLNEIEINEDIEDSLNTVITQCIRNAIIHGIESPEDREVLGKNPTGRIDIHLAKLNEEVLELSITDDGHGFDYKKIREKAKKIGRWSNETIENWDRRKLISLIFSNGFSTSGHISTDAGRGMGMNVIRKKVRDADGRILVSSRKGSYSKFVIELPYECNRAEVA